MEAFIQLFLHFIDFLYDLSTRVSYQSNIKYRAKYIGLRIKDIDFKVVNLKQHQSKIIMDTITIIVTIAGTIATIICATYAVIDHKNKVEKKSKDKDIIEDVIDEQLLNIDDRGNNEVPVLTNENVTKFLALLDHLQEINGKKEIPKGYKVLGTNKGQLSYIDNYQMQKIMAIGLIMHSIVFNKSAMIDCKYSDCHFERVDFEDTNIKNTLFMKTKFINCTFDNSKLSYVKFDSVVFQGSLEGGTCEINEVVFNECTFGEPTEQEVYAVFPNAKFVSCLFKDSSLAI
jgi:hypothetical protein